MEIGYYDFNPFIDAGIKEIEVRDRPGTVIINVCFFGADKT